MRSGVPSSPSRSKRTRPRLSVMSSRPKSRPTSSASPRPSARWASTALAASTRPLGAMSAAIGAGRADPVSRRAGEGRRKVAREILLVRPAEAPDEEVRLRARADDLGGQPLVHTLQPLRPAPSVAPGRASRVTQRGHAFVTDRQTGRGRQPAEQRLVGVVGADQAARAIK